MRLFLSLFLISIVSCQNLKNENLIYHEKDISELETSIVAKNTNFLIPTQLISSQNHLYIVDEGKEQYIHKFNPAFSRFEKSTLTKGEGPHQFKNPPLVFNDYQSQFLNTIELSTTEVYRIKEEQNENEYLFSLPESLGLVNQVEFVNQNRLVGKAGLSNGNLFYYDLSSKSLKSTGFTPSLTQTIEKADKKFVFNSFIETNTQEEIVIAVMQYFDLVNFYDASGEIIKSIGEKEITPLSFFPEDELASIYTPVQSLAGDSGLKKMNVVLIIAESFSKEYIGALNNGDGYTPYLDQLIDSSFVLEETYANGKKSIEGLPAILSGIPTLMNTSYISSKYSSNKINSLGNFLKTEGYETVFYHGGENGTMGFNAFTSIAGIDEYVGRDQYPYEGDYDGNWGIFDEPFLQFCVEDLNNRNQPFFASIFTLSSHHPYTIPEKYIGKFREGPLPILESVGYADYSIHQFFETAKKQDWFKNTLFIITADHTSQSFRPSYNNRVGMYAIPLLFYAPGKIRPKRSKKVSQQSDIFPSVIDYLGYNSKIVSFGQSVFDATKSSFSVSYINGTYQLIDGDFCLHFNGEKTVRFYNRIEDPNLTNNLVGKNPTQLKPLELKLKAILQQYNNRILTNQLTVE